jgi:diacylglycerol kinase (ATP)
MNQEDIQENRWLVIVNPNAGKRKGEKDWPEISALLNEAGFNYIHEFTEHRDHARTMTEKYIMQGFRKIIVVGGDGTMNEVVNGVFRQDRFPTNEIILGMIMVGTGNDWGRMFCIKENYKKAVKTIKKQRLFVQDAGLVTYHDDEGEIKRYFINSAGIGYDALVVMLTNRAKDLGKGGPLSYLVNLVKGMFQYHHAYLGIEVDGQPVYKGRVFSISTGICKYSGGGMMQLPFAVPDDGLLDVTMFKNVTKLTVIRHIKKLYSGKFTHLSFVQTHQGKTVKIHSLTQSRVFLETDGESLGYTPILIEIVPKSLKIIAGKKWFKNQEANA